MLLVTKDLSTGYRQKNGQIAIHQNLNISLPEGKLITLIGPNGSGKSTMLKTISGLLDPLSGSVFIDQKNLKNSSNQEKSRLISLVLTDRIVNGYLSVEELVSFGRYPYTGWGGKLSPADWLKVDEAISLCSLDQLRDKNCDQLSDGERQRAMIARAIAQDTPIIILDEPTAHLDLSYRVEILTLLKQLSRKTNKSIVVATHELELALNLADQMWLMPKKGEFFNALPEELALNGSISSSFNSALVQFDETHGNFNILSDPHQSVSLSGEGPRRFWTQKALNREGIGTKPEAEIKIVVSEKHWLVNNEECQSLSEVLTEVQQLLKKTA